MSCRSSVFRHLLEQIAPSHVSSHRVPKLFSTSATSTIPSANMLSRSIADVTGHPLSCPATPEAGTCCSNVAINVASIERPRMENLDASNAAPQTNNQTLSPPITNIRKQFYRRPLPDICISFSSPEGKVIFAEALGAGHMDSYFPLASQFRTQDEPAFCGLTSLVMALNSLEVDPHRVWKGPWRYYDENMLDCCVPLATVVNSGITMDQFACLAACNTLHVRMVRADAEASVDEFRRAVVDSTRSTDQVVISSYSRQAMQQTGDGHFSPIGGYHPGRDLVLIMDTARFKYPPHWVSLHFLYAAMERLDKTSNLPRGYFVLSKSRVRHALLFHLSSTLSPMSLEKKQSSVVTFLHSWQQWLLTEVDATFRSPADIVRFAASRLVQLVDVLDNESFLLATYAALTADEQCPDMIKSQSAMQVNGDSIRHLIFALESLPIYRLVEEIQSSYNTMSIDKIGRPSTVIIPESISTDNAGLEELPSDLSVNSTKLKSADIQVTGTHFIAMLLLSWPYHRCSHNTFAVKMQRYVATQWRLSGCVPGVELVHNEAARLRQQLATLINYAGAVRCGDGVIVTGNTLK